jgi:prepilin-type N-terminal cleavage/methylation domain-containing protein
MNDERYLKDIIVMRDKGFTLIELLAALAVMAIVAALLWPRVASLSRWKLESAARSLAGDLRLVRQEAITTGKASKVEIFIYPNRYRVRLSGEDRWVDLPEGVFFDGVTFGGNPPYVHFNMLGHPSSGGTIILKSSRGEKRYVILTPVTGRVRVSRNPPGHWQSESGAALQHFLLAEFQAPP